MMRFSLFIFLQKKDNIAKKKISNKNKINTKTYQKKLRLAFTTTTTQISTYI